MKNLKFKFTIAVISTTVILFFITFLAINFYQKNYVFDKAISSLENSVEYFKSYDEYLAENKGRFFNVELMFLDNEYQLNYMNREEKFFQNLYIENKLSYDKIEKISNTYGEYYILMTKVANNLDQGDFYENGIGLKQEEISVIFYTDITLSNNIVNKINIVFFIMLIIMIVVEGMVGVYLGSKFENSQSKLKHFFQNASHELKSPLMSIQGYAEGIKTGVVNDTDMATDIIINKSQKMKLLVDEILNISKLDSKEYILKSENINILDIVEESLEGFEALAKEKNIKVNLDVKSKNTEVKVDSLQIYKAINTIIDNAFKYSKTKVEICVYSERKFLYISIFNDGENINEEDSKHIFDRFYSSGSLSTGIGLAMAKEILSLSKGDVLFENIKGGVVFKIKIPQK